MSESIIPFKRFRENDKFGLGCGEIGGGDVKCCCGKQFGGVLISYANNYHMAITERLHSWKHVQESWRQVLRHILGHRCS